MGFEQFLADSCVFRLVEGEQVALLLVLHVDDIFVVEQKEVEIIHEASQYQHADFLTKALLPEKEFVFHRDYVMNLR